MVKRIKKLPTEQDEQKTLVEYLELKGYKFTSIPNSTYTTSWKQRNKNKTMGLRKGLPDLLVIIRNHLVFIEMKRLKRYKIEESQSEWIKELNKCTDVRALICKGFDEARVAVDLISKIL
jgi:5'-3' exonuclease